MADPERWIADGWMAAPFVKRTSKTILEARRAEEERAPPKRVMDAAALALARSRAAAALVVGARVEARFQASLNVRWKTFWFPGTIAAVHDDSTFGVRYDDGDHEDFVKRRFIRILTPAKERRMAAAAAAAAAASNGDGLDERTRGSPHAQDAHGMEDEEDEEDVDEEVLDALGLDDLGELYGAVRDP